MHATAPAPAGWRASWDRATRLLPWLVDAGIVAGVALFALIDLALGPSPVGAVASFGAVLMAAVRRWAALPAFLVLVVGSVALAWTARVAPDLSYNPPLAPAVAISALVTSLVRRQPVPVAVTAAGLGALGVVAAAGWPLALEVQVMLGALLGGTYALGVGTGMYLRHLDDSQVRAAEAARRAERLDLARELHDLVAHYVTGIVVQAQAAQVVAGRDPAAAGAALERIEVAGRDALTAMRGMVGTLRGAPERAAVGGGDGALPVAPPVALDDLDGLGALAERSRATGLPVQLEVAPDAGRAARGAVAVSTHRIVQEALTNVHRHAVEPTHAEVDVRLHGPALVVTVTDDGRQPVGGPDDRTLTGAGFGLVGMTERAAALSGWLAAGPLDPPDHGWRVQAVLPLGPA